MEENRKDQEGQGNPNDQNKTKGQTPLTSTPSNQSTSEDPNQERRDENTGLSGTAGTQMKSDYSGEEKTGSSTSETSTEKKCRYSKPGQVSNPTTNRSKF